MMKAIKCVNLCEFVKTFDCLKMRGEVKTLGAYFSLFNIFLKSGLNVSNIGDGVDRKLKEEGEENVLILFKID